MGLAWLHSGPTSLYSDAVWLGSLLFSSLLGSEYLGAVQVEAGSNEPPPPTSFLWKVKLYSLTAGGSPQPLEGGGDYDCLKGLMCKEARQKAQCEG